MSMADRKGKEEEEEAVASSKKRSSPTIQEARKKQKKIKEKEVKAPPPASKEGNTAGCRQCHKSVPNNEGSVVRCGNCRKRNYCVPCLGRWFGGFYPFISLASV